MIRRSLLVTPLAPKNAQIAILIDDGLRGSFSLQLNEIKSFLTELPQGTQTLVGYMQNGTIRTKGFSTNHEEEVALRSAHSALHAECECEPPTFLFRTL